MPSFAKLNLLQHGYYPFWMDCTSLKISPDRYLYATCGYVASEKKALPSARLHIVQDGIHGIISNYGPSGGHEHESPVADVLLNETEEISSWTSSNSFTDKPCPFVVFHRGYWKENRFHDVISGIFRIGY